MWSRLISRRDYEGPRRVQLAGQIVKKGDGMTILKGVVKRRVDVHGISRPVSVILDGETKRIGFAEKGCHKVYWLSIQTAYAMAIRANEEEK